jgi:hypothetical protein
MYVYKQVLWFPPPQNMLVLPILFTALIKTFKIRINN